MFILILLIGHINFARADVTTWSDDFETYSVAGLNTQGSWSASSGINIISTPTFTGSRSVFINKATGGTLEASRTKDNVFADPQVYLRFNVMRSDSGASDDSDLTIGIYPSNFSASGQCTVRFDDDTAGNDIELVNSNGSKALGNHIDDTWYTVDIHMDNVADVCYARIDEGSWSTSLARSDANSTFTIFDFFRQGTGNDRNWYIDDLEVSDSEITGWEGDGTVNLTDINIINPSTGSTTASKTIYTSITGALDSAFAPEYVTEITGIFCSQTFPEDECTQVHWYKDDTWTNDSSFNVSTTTTLARNGRYLMLASFSDGVENVYKSVSSTFLVATSTITAEEIITALGSIEVAFDACGTDASLVGEALCKTLVYLFYPSTESWNRAELLKNNLHSRAPFGYFYQLYDGIASTTLTASTTPVLTLQLGATIGNWTILSEATIKQYIGTTTWNLFYSMMQWGLWISAMFYIFKRVPNIIK